MVRSRITALRTREAVLCAELEQADLLGRTGKWTQAELVERRIRVFDHRLLPEAVQQDPVFWVERLRLEVRCRLRDGARVPIAMRRAEIAAPLMGTADANLIGGAAWF
ncbi:hypothetical protein [Pararhodobacter aggregans]|uniref:hypothetical protein n=1 Tax=Pararhodobacter aggregans TaxID=404875 RepID=UPI001EDE7402|nr:hypothetical protein [Pararhodobacter aggregans]